MDGKNRDPLRGTEEEGEGRREDVGGEATELRAPGSAGRDLP